MRLSGGEIEVRRPNMNNRKLSSNAYKIYDLPAHFKTLTAAAITEVGSLNFQTDSLQQELQATMAGFQS